MGPIVIIYNETHRIDSELNLHRDYYISVLLQFGHVW